MSRRHYDENTKAAVMAALLEGQSVSSVAKEYQIPKGTVSQWKRKAVQGVAGGATQKRDEATGSSGSSMGELLLELLEKNVRSLIAISEVVSDEKWLKKQSAAELATLFGVKHDKAVRMIEALNSSADDASSP